MIYDAASDLFRGTRPERRRQEVGLGSSEHRFLDRLRQRNRAEQGFRVDVIVSGFVYDPEKAVLLGRNVAKHDIDFSLFERSRVARILDADDQLL